MIQTTETSFLQNHGSDSCTNAFIPDHGNFIYRGTKDAVADSTLSGFRQNLVADLGIKASSLPLGTYPRPGYQNAPKFCANTDRALGTYSFNVPGDLEAGNLKLESASKLVDECMPSLVKTIRTIMGLIYDPK